MDKYESLQVTPEERHFYEQLRCFNFCVKNFKENSLNKEEKLCVQNCFEKFRQAEKIFLNKMKDNMEYLVVMDPALRLKFKEAQKNKDK